VVLLNAQSGEIFVMASHPTFDPRRLDEIGSRLNRDPDKPLINRAVQGVYPIGTMIQPFSQALSIQGIPVQDDLQPVYETFGFDRTPLLRTQVAEPVYDDGGDLHISPLQVALASGALSNHGTQSTRPTMAGWCCQPWGHHSRRSPLRQRTRSQSPSARMARRTGPIRVRQKVKNLPSPGLSQGHCPTGRQPHLSL
jgi:Penicillin binding protein transpeptidase domain